jgi:hypothetical protein
LEKLNVSGCKHVTREGLKYIQKELPNCEIIE